MKNQCEYYGATTAKGFFKDWKAALECLIFYIIGFATAKLFF